MNLLHFVIGILFATSTAQATTTLQTNETLRHAENEMYSYKLITSKNAVLCKHMTAVYNERFRHPLERGNKPYSLSGTTPMLFGVRYDNMFERLAGVAYDKGITWDILLSKYPSSPEYDAIRWREGRYLGGFPGDESRQYRPFLVAEIDIDKDEQVDELIKTNFMTRKTLSEGVGSSYGGEDSLTIFYSGGLDLNRLDLDALFSPNTNTTKSRAYDLQLGQQMRPFLYRGTVYIAAYEQSWAPSKRVSRFPSAEFMNIYRVTRQLKDASSDAATGVTSVDEICQIQMHSHPIPTRYLP